MRPTLIESNRGFILTVAKAVDIYPDYARLSTTVGSAQKKGIEVWHLLVDT